MYEMIAQVAQKLLKNHSGDHELLSGIAQLISDADYQAYFLGEIAQHFIKRGNINEASQYAAGVRGLERSRVLSMLAASAVEAGHKEYGRILLDEAMQATDVNRFPLEKATAILEVAKVLQRCDFKDEAVRTFMTAIDIAAPSQSELDGTGREASGVIYYAIQGLHQLGCNDMARQKA